MPKVGIRITEVELHSLLCRLQNFYCYFDFWLTLSKSFSLFTKMVDYNLNIIIIIDN